MEPVDGPTLASRTVNGRLSLGEPRPRRSEGCKCFRTSPDGGLCPQPTIRRRKKLVRPGPGPGKRCSLQQPRHRSVLWMYVRRVKWRKVSDF
ncbi:hypothetical protein D4764_08G0004920 [Takifugu flavidus]|uniref:Uncharacterized protein n=1 Tax=Takifugu flavidus TaxID=433684 RepID=A0A5C6MP42_9TELE|nr:hypothetical protein D4764_08G0004920 [Takifugu flavidus]